jgi:hypothetical protein
MSGDARTIVTLPGGFWLEGQCYRDAELRPVTGRDEAFLLDVADALLPAQWTTAILARCLVRLGPLRPVTLDGVRALTVGDREALLLHLRRLTLGDRLQGVLSCPQPRCGKKMDLNLKVSNLLVPPQPNPQAKYEATLTANETTYWVQFRLPTGADQEAVADLAQQDLEAAAQQVLSRCIAQVKAKEATASHPVHQQGMEQTSEVPETIPAIAQQLPLLMAEHDPQAELQLQLLCPECGQPLTTTFDTATYFRQELASWINNLYREVHLLAFYYHWSEAEILRMTAKKRQRYLELLTAAVREG